MKDNTMATLTETQFRRARDFVKAHARPIDRALFEMSFEGAPPERVLDELAAFQNDDGGFGHAMEPDFRLRASSPMATSAGLHYAAEAGAAATTPLVRRALAYLVDTLDRENGFWHRTSIEVNDEPHAPWWHVAAPRPPSADEWPHPSAELLGYLYRWGSEVDRGLLESVSSRALWSLENGPGPNSAHNMPCWQRVYPSLPTNLQAAVFAYLQAGVRVLELPPRDEMRMIWLTPTPTSPIAQAAEGHPIREYIGAEVQKQSPDGSWQPNWQWGQYPEAWEVAKREWAGKITVDVLRALKAWGLMGDGNPWHEVD
jgi:hypothetical protein